jgi:hypothetical protein
MFQKLYLLLGTAVLGVYGTAAFMGWETGGYGRETSQQAAARHASGGHRLFWISSYRAGK